MSSFFRNSAFIFLALVSYMGHGHIMHKNVFKIFPAKDHWKVEMEINTYLLNEKMLSIHPDLKGKDMNKVTYKHHVDEYLTKNFFVTTGAKCWLYPESYHVGPHIAKLVYKIDGADMEPDYMKLKVALLSEDHDHVINHVLLKDGLYEKSFEFNDEFHSALYDFKTHEFSYIDDFEVPQHKNHYWMAIALMAVAVFFLFGFFFLDKK